jgi:hypothetical protein
MTIWEITAEALAYLGVPVVANALIPESNTPMPDTFLVYSLVSSSPLLHADNLESMRMYRMQVTAYSRDGLAGLPDVPGAMVDVGFTRGPMREIPYNADTRHYGLVMEFVYYTDAEVSESY